MHPHPPRLAAVRTVRPSLRSSLTKGRPLISVATLLYGGAAVALAGLGYYFFMTDSTVQGQAKGMANEAEGRAKGMANQAEGSVKGMVNQGRGQGGSYAARSRMRLMTSDARAFG